MISAATWSVGWSTAEVEPCGAQRAEDHRGGPLAPVPPPSRRGRACRAPPRRRWPGSRQVATGRRSRPSCRGSRIPAGRMRPISSGHGRIQQRRGEEHDQIDGEMPESAENDQCCDRSPGDDAHGPRPAQCVDVQHHPGQRLTAHRRHGPQHDKIATGDEAEDRRDRQRHPEGSHEPHEQQVPPGDVVDTARQRWRLPGGPASPAERRRGDHRGDPRGLRRLPPASVLCS